MLSEKIAIISLSAGFFTAVSHSFLDSIFEKIFFEKISPKTNTLNLRRIVNISLVQGCVGGWLIGVIFYAFAISEPKPIQTIITYSIILGIATPIISKLLVFVYYKLVSREKIS